VLGRLGLLLAVDDRDVGHSNAEEIVAAESVPELHQRLYEWGRLNVANCATQLNDADTRLFLRVIHWEPGHPFDPGLNLVRQMRHDLDRLPQIVASSFFLLPWSAIWLKTKAFVR
jgi:hypothetical protein